MATKLGEPDPADRQPSYVVARCGRSRAESAVGIVRREEREIFGGEVPRWVHPVGASPGQDLTSGAHVEVAQRNRYVGLTQLGRGVCVVHGTTYRHPPFGEQSHVTRQRRRPLEPCHSPA